MENIEITKIEILQTSELSVTPVVNWNNFFQYIYRAATGVIWSNENQCFMSPTPREWSHYDWYVIIVTSVASEMGVNLVLTTETKWLNVSKSMQDEITSYDSSKNT